MSLQNNKHEVSEDSDSEDEYADNDNEEEHTDSEVEYEVCFEDEGDLSGRPNNSFEDDEDDENHYEEENESGYECERDSGIENEGEGFSLINAEENNESSSEDEVESVDQESGNVLDFNSVSGVTRMRVNGEIVWHLDRNAFNDLIQYWAREQGLERQVSTPEATSDRYIIRISRERRRASRETFRQGLIRRPSLMKGKKGK